ncbi:pirin [Rudanella paleaurantiibacter]|uniref:Pirin n=1 Tax=Rudanella paleaurantiibacter TaxID=2614655 RepID=A0A7J5TTV0_9BACT|nr:pirin [Rudanella paleaurantiibacter]KAB7727126.1 pirin [Rudanella paleaurantiibacter]
MDTQTDVQIFLATERGRSESEGFRSYHTFKFGAYRQEGRQPFGALQLLNDDVLRPGASLSLRVEQPTEVLLLPLVGGLEYGCGAVSDFLEPGGAAWLSLAADESYTVTNPYETEYINVLHCWRLVNEAQGTPKIRPFAIDVSHRNKLLPLGSPATQACWIGQFDGRAEGRYSLTDAQANVFVLVLQGAFEVANRLLEAKDGLALRGVQDAQIEFEALSEEAILLLLEC